MYGAGINDKKLMAEVFSKLMDSNAKLNILRVALQKYKGRLGEAVSSDFEKEQQKLAGKKKITFHISFRFVSFCFVSSSF